MGEEGYIEPPVIDSAQRRALVIKNKKKVAELEAELSLLQERLAEAIAAKKGTDRIEASIARTMQLIKKFERTDPDRNPKDTEKRFDSITAPAIIPESVKEIRFMGSFSPDYEFDCGDEVNIEKLLGERTLEIP